ncbi:MAG: hypothetical protein IJE43_22625 [Alphaproteobacteria bacterium]|nr:hypothetical protein [Alphaproteobacteria bacterium]
MSFLLASCSPLAVQETSEPESVSEEVSRIYLENVTPTVTDTTVVTDEGTELTILANQIYTPIQVTQDDIEQRITELKNTYPTFSDRELAALLVANCSYMEPEVFDSYVTTYFDTTYSLMNRFREYQMYKIKYSDYNYVIENTSADYSGLVTLDKFYFDPYLIYQATKMEENISLALTAWENNRKASDVFIFFYHYMMYSQADGLLFMRGDLRVDGNGLLVTEYFIDDFCVRFLSYFWMKYPTGNDVLGEPSALIDGQLNYQVFINIDTIKLADSMTRTDLERLIVDEVNRVLDESLQSDTTTTSAS